MLRDSGCLDLRIVEILENIERLRPRRIAFELAGRTEPTPALAASVRRALLGLRKQGRVVRVMDEWMLAETWQRRSKQREHEEELERRRETQNRGEDGSAHDQAKTDDRYDEVLERRFRGQIDYLTEMRRLPKILALLGSPHEGEVLNAARQAEQIRSRLRLSWEEIISPPVRLARPTPAIDRPDYDSLISELILAMRSFRPPDKDPRPVS